MTIQHLIDNGQCTLAEYRTREAEAEALAKQFESEQRAEEWAKTLEPLLAVLPAELHRYIEYDATEAPGWRGLNNVWIAAVPGNRIHISHTDHMLRFYPQKAARIVRNFYRDPVEFYVEYEHAQYDGYADPLVALAHAAELAPANLAMEAEAKAQCEAAAAKEAMEKAEPSDQERIGDLIDAGNHIEAIARTLLWIAVNLENR